MMTKPGQLRLPWMIKYLTTLFYLKNLIFRNLVKIEFYINFLTSVLFKFCRLFCVFSLKTVTKPHTKSLFKLYVKNIKSPYWLCQITCSWVNMLVFASSMPRVTKEKLSDAPPLSLGTGARKDPHLTSSKNTSSNSGPKIISLCYSTCERMNNVWRKIDLTCLEILWVSLDFISTVFWKFLMASSSVLSWANVCAFMF